MQKTKSLFLHCLKRTWCPVLELCGSLKMQRTLIENATSKSTRAVTKWSLKIEMGMVVKTNPAIKPCAFTTDDCSDFVLDKTPGGVNVGWMVDLCVL